jgi:2-keto-4-pentenoate hydratase/2-oxohepta-3-ene-1,7-dioic acid hydratase in catechol pathway
MRLVSYDAGDGARAGYLEDGLVVDAWAALGEPHRGGIDDLRSTLGDTGHPSRPQSAVAILPPIPDPDKIICIGLNYRKHAVETGMEAPAHPIVFGKYRNALAAAGSTVKLPGNSDKVDYEAEVAFVIGERAKDVAAADALDYVAGYTLFNDLSARDLQGRTPQWMPGKIFDGSAPCGPALVTPEEAGPADAIEIKLSLNGETMQDSTTGDLIFSIPELIADLSSLMTLEPGDIIATGTPEGVGMGRQPRVWLQDGDEIVIESPTLGRLETTIAR